MTTWQRGLGVAAAVGATVGVGALGWKVRELVGRPPAPIGYSATADQLARAVDVLARYPAIDTHAHPGRTFVGGAQGLAWKMRLYAMRGTFEDRAVRELREGHVAAACFSAVSDFPVLDARAGWLTGVREFEPGEAWAYYRTQMDALHRLVASGQVHQVLEVGDIEAARATGRPGAILGVEGADFLDGDLSRVSAAFDDGVRILTLVHYLAGGVIGDVMTSPPVHGGLTPFGREVVAEMNRVGIVVDVSHASEATAFDALEVADRPLLATHTDLLVGGRSSPRFISLGLAREIAGAGGVIGAWPAGITLNTLDEYVRRIADLVELLGEDHVCLGSDMDANYRPVFETYAKMPLLVAGMLDGGMSEETIAKVIGGNFLRVFTAATPH